MQKIPSIEYMNITCKRLLTQINSKNLHYLLFFWRAPHIVTLDHTTGDLKIRTPPLRVDPDPNLPEFCLFLFFAEFYFLTVLIFWIKSSEFCWFLFFGNISITFFDVLIFWNSKIFSPPALENQCKSRVYPTPPPALENQWKSLVYPL